MAENCSEMLRKQVVHGIKVSRKFYTQLFLRKILICFFAYTTYTYTLTDRLSINYEV